MPRTMGKVVGSRTQMLLLIGAYYVTATLTSCLTKQVLDTFPRPVTVSLVQQFFTAVGGCARVRSIRSAMRVWLMVLPVSFALAVAAILYRTSLVYNTLSFSQAVKTLQPLFASFFSTALLRERVSVRRLLALLLLLTGVCIATKTELSFSLVGFLCALGACVAQAFQVVLSKALLLNQEMDPNDFFTASATCTLLMLLPVWLYLDAASLVVGETPGIVGTGAALLLVLNGISNYAAQSLSFAVLCRVTSPVSATVVSTFKRVVTIVTAIIWFHTPVTVAHAFGVIVAVIGVALFQDRMQHAGTKRAPLLPTSQGTPRIT